MRWGEAKLRLRQARFWSQVTQTSACWLWTARPDRCGYGDFRFTIGGTPGRIRAHQAAWALRHGRLPGPGEVIRHTCDTPDCLRPDHLVAGTHADNVRDRVRRGRSARGERHGRAKLREADVVRIRERLACGESVSQIARDHGVHRKTIHQIRDGTT